MGKKIILLLIVLSVISGSVFAQEQDAEAEVKNERAKNSIAGSFGIIGAALSYERIFNRYFSVLADTSYTTLVLIDEFTVAGKGRVYPFGGAFYLEMGLGFSYGRGMTDLMVNMLLGVLTFGYYFTTLEEDDLLKRRAGFLVQPGLGWKIDIGKKDGFVLPINLGVNIRVGDVPDALPFLRIGLGYSF